MTNYPSIILIRPQMGENIGAAARVCKNFGLSDLRIVSPRDGWPNQKAIDMSAHAADIVENATIYNKVSDSIADLQMVYATTARERAMEKPVFSPREAMQARSDDVKMGILFGPERTGLENEELALCNAIISMDVNPDYPSLNLAQAVAIMCYESRAGEENRESRVESRDGIKENFASKAELQGLFDHLEGELDGSNFWKVERKKPAMWRNIRNIFQRSNLTEQEVRTLRGIISCLIDKERGK